MEVVRVGEIIKNEKYAGNALLQKKYVKYHLTKSLVLNKGNIPMYYADGTHPAIIDVETYQKANEIISRNSEKCPHVDIRVRYPSTSKIVCGICGKKYNHKNSRGRVTWNCSTFLKYGKESCPSKQISEDILISVTIEVLGLKEFNEVALKDKIKEIQVPQQYQLIFVLRNGTTMKRE